MGKIKAALIFLVFLAVVVVTVLFFVFPEKQNPPAQPVVLNPTVVEGNSSALWQNIIPINGNNILNKGAAQLANPPEIIKAVYVTANSAGSKNYMDYLTGLVKDTEINSAVIDLKNDAGYISFDTGSEKIKSYGTTKPIYNIDDLVKKLHGQGIYLIARIEVFKDQSLIKSRPDLAIFDNKKSTEKQKVLWQGEGKTSWLDPASQEVWNYNIALAQNAIEHGFDEINFDYMRFPADGNIEDASFPFWDQITPEHVIIKNFFQKIRQDLPGQKLSIDLFGYSAIVSNDVGIGQKIEDAFDYFNYVSPMVYPSHYSPDFLSFKNPADHPYEVIKYTLEQALSRQTAYNSAPMEKPFAFGNKNGFGNFSIAGVVSSSLKDWIEAMETLQPQEKIQAKFRPWLQDFNLGAEYTADMVKQEIKATADVLGNDFTGYMLWNPSNVYTKDAILKAAN